MNEASALHIELQHVIWESSTQRQGPVKPYLWSIFFRMDGHQLTLSDSFQLTGEADFHLTPGSHGNLEVGAVQPGDAITIPPSLGVWQTELHPIKVPFFSYQIPGQVGVLVVLMLEQNVTPEGAEAGHQGLNAYVKKAVNDAIHSFDVKQIDVERIQDSIREYFRRQVDNMEPEVEKRVALAIMKQQSIWENLWTLLDKDDLIGYQIWDISERDVPADSAGLLLAHTWQHSQYGNWSIKGRVWLQDQAPDKLVNSISIDS